MVNYFIATCKNVLYTCARASIWFPRSIDTKEQLNLDKFKCLMTREISGITVALSFDYMSLRDGSRRNDGLFFFCPFSASFSRGVML